MNLRYTIYDIRVCDGIAACPDRGPCGAGCRMQLSGAVGGQGGRKGQSFASVRLRSLGGRTGRKFQEKADFPHNPAFSRLFPRLKRKIFLQGEVEDWPGGVPVFAPVAADEASGRTGRSPRPTAERRQRSVSFASVRFGSLGERLSEMSKVPPSPKLWRISQGPKSKVGK
jgi:hypothetical protein